MAKPIQLTIVNEVPRDSAGACCATNVEKRGESAITANPQMNRNNKKKKGDDRKKTIGNNKQQIQDTSSA